MGSVGPLVSDVSLVSCVTNVLGCRLPVAGPLVSLVTSVSMCYVTGYV